MKDHQKIFEGLYNYYESSKLYSEESFSVYASMENNGGHVFESEILTRCPNGEFLKVVTDYRINKEGFPHEVTINRYLGTKQSKEIFSPSYNEQLIRYTFRNNESEENVEFPLAMGRFHVVSPSAATALLILNSKKFDPTKRNAYNVVISENVWEYTSPIRQTYVYLEAENQFHGLSEQITLNGQTKEARKYLYFEKAKQEDFTGKSTPEQETPVTFYVSDHMDIPYKIILGPENYVEVTYLKDLRNSGLTDIAKSL